MPPGGGLLLVDKPSGRTSHDVVGRLRRAADPADRARRHAGPDGDRPAGAGRRPSTKLLGHLALTDKTYLATIRLGEQTDTDDAEG